MKILSILLVLSLAFSPLFAEYAPGLYVVVNEIKESPFVGDLPIEIWEPVTDRTDAETKLQTVLAEHFVGKTYEARLHWHYLDKPCVVEIIATGTYNP